MKSFALFGLVLAVLVPSASGAGCSPLTCGPSQVGLAHGSLLGIRAFGSDGPLRVLDLRTGRTRWRLPSGVLAGRTLVHQDGTLLTWFDAVTGARVADTVVQARGSFTLVGSSQDGTRAVLARTQHRSTTFAIASRTRQQRVVLGKNNWAFDALSGDKLFLLQYVKRGYLVRLYDLASNTLEPRPLKDAGEPALIAGVAWSRASSPDGRYLFTLYIDPDGGAMLHQLDVRRGYARCIDLPGRGDFNAATSYALSFSFDGRTLWAVSPGYGKVAAVDVARGRVRDTFGFAATAPASPVGALGASSPDGGHVAVASAGRLWLVTPAKRRVAEPMSRVATALGFAPNSKSLWTVGLESRASALPVH